MAANNPVPKIYRAVIEDVIKNVRESFLNEGVDEAILNELKQLWENKLQQSRAIDVIPSDVNVRVSLTYPHSSQTAASSTQSSLPTTVQPAPKPAARPQATAVAPTTTPTQTVFRNAAGQQQQVVYVSNHPTLGHVGPMTGAAVQATMALQNAAAAAGRGQPHAIIRQPIMGMPGQVIVQAQPGAPNIYQHFQGHVAAVGQRVIYAPATATPATVAAAAAQPAQIQAAQQQQAAAVAAAQRTQQVAAAQRTQQVAAAQRAQQAAAAAAAAGQKPPNRNIVQVDGANDEQETCCSPTTSTSTKPRQQRRCRKPSKEIILQFDGPNDSDSEDEEEEEEEDFDNVDIPVAAGGISGGGVDIDEPGEEEEPLNSEDDVTDDEEQADLFDTDNVVVCQYDKIARTRNRWKFHLKDGIMNLNSKDFVFHKANGDAEW